VTKSGLDQWRRKLGRPGKEERAMGSPPLESTNNSLSIEKLYIKNRRACGDSLWSEHKTIKLLGGGGSCYEAET